MKVWKNFILVAICALSTLLIAGEIAVRSIGAVDFPLYDGDNTIGYIPKANQSGSFLNKNDWIFNELHMGSRPFAPSSKTDVLVVGDSVVLGGNPLKQSERLAPQIESISEVAAWPISAGSWSLRNELTYLRQNINVLDKVNVVVFVLNTGDLDNASSWKCELTHPRTKPFPALWYLFKKYLIDFGECDTEVMPDLAVKNGDLLAELKDYLQIAGSKTYFILYPDKPELSNQSLWQKNSIPLKAFLQSAGVLKVTDLTNNSKWNASLYRDGIHPNAAGNAELAAVILNVVKSVPN